MPIYSATVSSSFNTQPPEGGWDRRPVAYQIEQGFNTQPPEGGWGPKQEMQVFDIVSTHSRLKAAGIGNGLKEPQQYVSTHSRLKAAGAELYRPAAISRFQHTAA